MYPLQKVLAALAGILLTSVLLTSVALSQDRSSTDNTSNPLVKKDREIIAQMEQDLGRRFWLSFPEQKAVVLCPSPAHRLDQCKVVTQGSFVVETIALDHGYSFRNTTIFGSKFYYVRFADDSTGYVPFGHRQYFLTSDPMNAASTRKASYEAAKSACEMRGEPRLNMTKDEVLLTCWGVPRRTVHPTWAPEREYLIYDKGRLLMFENGRLIVIR